MGHLGDAPGHLALFAGHLDRRFLNRWTSGRDGDMSSGGQLAAHHGRGKAGVQ